MKRYSRFSHLIQLMGTLGPDAELGQLSSSTWHPLVDIYERDEAIVVVVELPGVEKSQIRVTAEGDVLKITGVRNKRIPSATQHVHQMEIPYGPFMRSVKLPSCSDIESIQAEYRDGYLTIEIPRMVK